MPQYEMGLRDYWRILRKRKLAVILTCLATGGLTFYLTQHVFIEPPTYSATTEISVSAAEVADQAPVFPVRIPREAKLIKSQMLLRKVVWAVEHYPFNVEPSAPPATPASTPRSEEELLRRELFKALAPPTRVAKTRMLVTLFRARPGDLTVKRISDIADAQQRAVIAANKKGTTPAERTAALAQAQSKASMFVYDDPKLLETIIAQFQSRMTVEYDERTSSFKAELETAAPGFDVEAAGRGSEAAVHLAETVASVYKTYAEWRARRTITREIERIDARIAGHKSRREQWEQERRALQVQIEEKTASAEFQSAQSALRAATDKLNRLKRYMNQLQNHLAERTAIKQKPAKDKIYPPMPAPAEIRDSHIQQIYSSSIALENQKNDKLEFYKPGSFVVTALDDKIGRKAKELQTVVQSSMDNAQQSANDATALFKASKSKLPTQELAAVEDLNQKINYEVRDIAALNARRSRLSLFQQGMKVEIISPPGTPEELGQASAVAKTAIGALMGLIIGVVIAVLWETFDLTIGTIEEVESFLGTRVLGVVPHVEADKLAAEIRADDPEGEAETSDAELQQRAMLVTLYDPKSVSAEAFRHVRTTLDFATQQVAPGAKVFLITSATLYEGKTVTAANLAVVMAQNGKRTCLVECDMRRPQLHRVFGLNRRPGLYDVFIGKLGWREARKTLSDLLMGRIGMEIAVGTPGLENLSILTCGTVPPNPVELLDSAETRRFFAELREAFDVVIIDSPPILPVPDAAVLSPFADGAILVYRAGSAPRTILGRAKTQLESVDMSLMGVVLNDLRPAAGEISATYPYKGYARKAYALPEEHAAPRIAVAPAETVIDRAGETAEDRAIRKVDMLLAQNKPEQAVEAAYAAVRALPQSISVRLQLAKACAASMRTLEAQAELIQVLDMDPRNERALQRLAEMARDAGLEREALRWYEEILEFAPENAEATARAEEIRRLVTDADTGSV